MRSASALDPARTAIPRHRLRVPLAGHALAVMRDPIEFQRRGHARYGPLFQAEVFDNRLLFLDPIGAPELFERFARAPDEELSIIEAYKQLLGRLVGTELFVAIDRDMRHGLSFKYIRRHLEATARRIPEVLERELPGREGRVDGLRFCNDFVLDTAANYVLGPEATARSGAELAQLMHVLESDYSVLGMFLPIETPSMRRRTAAFERLVELTRYEVRWRVEHGGEHDDFLAYALGQLDADADLRPVVIRMLGLIFGAHTNTAMALAACLLDLLEHPEVLAELRAEIDELPADATLDAGTLRGLGALHRAINESMRLRSTGGIWRRVCAPFELGEFALEPGALVGASMGLINLDPARYSDPGVYRPRRYASMSTDSYQSPPVSTAPPEFGVFGTGRSLCSGRPLAYALLSAMLVELLRGYEWQLVAKPRRWFNLLTAGMARPVGGLELRYRRR